MGNDGGVIAVKRKFMRHANQKTKGEKLDQDTLRRERAQTCAISGEPLAEPIVACTLGNLYNKQALLQHLLAKTVPERFAHVTSLKDVVNCRLTRAPPAGGAAPTAAVFHCPVTMLELNGKHPFVVRRACGCVLSERATKEVQATECLVCGGGGADASADGTADTEPLIALFVSEEQYAERQQALLERKAREKQQRKKRRAAAAADDESTTEGPGNDKKAAARREKKKARVAAAEARPQGDRNATIAHEAAAAIEKEKQSSQVYASLFAKDKDASKKSASELLMAVGGMRYTLS